MCRPRFRTLLTPFVVLAIAITGCNTPSTIARFCSSANSVLNSGTAIFQDIPESCARSEAASTPFTSFKPVPLLNSPEAVPASQTDPCDAYKAQAPELIAASKILANYFLAMSHLASFGTAQLGNDVGATAQRITIVAAQLDSREVGAVRALSSLTTDLLTSGYQRKHLNADIQAADGEVKAVTAALRRVVTDNYLLQLDNEQTRLSQRYQQFLTDNPCPRRSEYEVGRPDEALQPGQTTAAGLEQARPGKVDHSCHVEALILLQDRWQQDLKTLKARRRAANAFAYALAVIAEGHTTLAANANRLKAKEVPGLLSPYTDELQNVAAALAQL